MNAITADRQAFNQEFNNLLGNVDDDYVVLPGAGLNQQSRTPPQQVVRYDELPVAPRYEELPVAPEELSEEAEEFDLYAWMEENVQAIKADRAAAETAGRTIQDGLETITSIARGMQQATSAMAKSFQGADDERIAKIISLILEQQAAKIGEPNTTSSTVTLDDIDNKIVPPLKLMLYAAAGSTLGFCIVTIIQRLF